jgi:glycosyltransferase involved in cell wall biosynthesis
VILIINPWAGNIGPNVFLKQLLKVLSARNQKVVILYPYEDDFSLKFSTNNCKFIYNKNIKFSHPRNTFHSICLRIYIEFYIFIYSLSFLRSYSFKYIFYNTEISFFSFFSFDKNAIITNVIHSLSFVDNKFSKFMFYLQNLRIKRKICVSEAVYANMMKIYPSHNLKKVHNGVDLNYFNSDGKIFNLNKTKFRLLAVVHPVPHKGMHYLLEVLEFIYHNCDIEFHCDILGWHNVSMDKKYVDFINKKISNSCIKECINFEKKSNIIDFYSKADLLIHPSLNESFCYVIAEALAMQIPVVAFNVGALSELITNNKSGYLINPYNTRLMGEKVINLLKSPNDRLEFSRNGKKIIEEKFDGIKNMEIVANLILNIE